MFLHCLAPEAFLLSFELLGDSQFHQHLMHQIMEKPWWKDFSEDIIKMDFTSNKSEGNNAGCNGLLGPVVC